MTFIEAVEETALEALRAVSKHLRKCEECGHTGEPEYEVYREERGKNRGKIWNLGEVCEKCRSEQIFDLVPSAEEWADMEDDALRAKNSFEDGDALWEIG